MKHVVSVIWVDYYLHRSWRQQLSPRRQYTFIRLHGIFFPEKQLSPKSSHHLEFTNARDIKNAVFLDMTPFTDILEHPAAHKVCSDEGGSRMPFNFDAPLLTR
jgi:hypothetical protein